MVSGLLAAFTACRERVEEDRTERETMDAEIARRQQEFARGLILCLQWTGAHTR